MTYEHILYAVHDAVATITINRPNMLNALHTEAYRELMRAYREAEADPAVRVVIATGAGDRAFCTGWDLNEAGKVSAAAEDPAFDVREAQNVTDRFYTGLFTTKPVIGAINGYAIAGGFEYLLMCDLVVASETAQFGLQEVRWAIMPGGGGTVRLPRKVPANIANEIVLLGDRFDAATAHRFGLANWVVPPEQVMPKALEVAATLCRRGPLGVRNAKRSLANAIDHQLQAAIQEEQRLFAELLATEDAREGPRAFLEKRDPVYHGR